MLYNIFFLRYFLVEVNTVLINVYTVFFEKTWVALQKKNRLLNGVRKWPRRQKALFKMTTV